MKLALGALPCLLLHFFGCLPASVHIGSPALLIVIYSFKQAALHQHRLTPQGCCTTARGVTADLRRSCKLLVASGSSPQQAVLWLVSFESGQLICRQHSSCCSAGR